MSSVAATTGDRGSFDNRYRNEASGASQSSRSRAARTGTSIAAIRASIDDDRTGPELEQMIKKLEGNGWRIGGHVLKTAPRGYDVAHPRIHLLRHKSLTIGHDYGFEPIIHTPELLEAVRDDWRTLRPFVEWVTAAEEAAA